MKNIVLIGMSSVGKSKSGIILSKSINKEYYDEDDNFELLNGPIHLIRNTLKEEHYQRLQQSNKEIMYNLENHVISAGGKTGMCLDLRGYFAKNSITVLLKPSLDYILNKYDKKKKDLSQKNLRRKLVFETNTIIAKEYELRYELMIKNADIILDTSYLKKGEIAALIESKI
jgi:shikimate kinase